MNQPTNQPTKPRLHHISQPHSARHYSSLTRIAPPLSCHTVPHRRHQEQHTYTHARARRRPPPRIAGSSSCRRRHTTALLSAASYRISCIVVETDTFHHMPPVYFFPPTSSTSAPLRPRCRLSTAGGAAGRGRQTKRARERENERSSERTIERARWREGDRRKERKRTRRHTEFLSGLDFFCVYQPRRSISQPRHNLILILILCRPIPLASLSWGYRLQTSPAAPWLARFPLH